MLSYQIRIMDDSKVLKIIVSLFLCVLLISFNSIYAEETKPDSRASEDAKHSVRVYTEDDIPRVRQLYDLGQGMFAQNAHETPEPDREKNTEINDNSLEQKRNRIRALQNHLEQAEKVYAQQNAECANLKGKIFGTDRIYKSSDGPLYYNPLPFFETIKKVCDDAAKSKIIIEETKAAIAKGKVEGIK